MPSTSTNASPGSTPVPTSRIAEGWETPRAVGPLRRPGSPVVFTTTRNFDVPRRAPVAQVAQAIRELALTGFQGPPSRVVFAGQVHGARVSSAGSRGDSDVWEVPECDGLLTDQCDVALVIRTADCYPVVVWDGRRRRLAAVHAGWRGTLAGIVGEAVGLLRSRGSQCDDLEAWVGPGIAGANYEVSEELVAEFTRVWGGLENFIEGRRLNLAQLNRAQLVAAGVAPRAVSLSSWCTFGDAHRFYSHRRDGSARGSLYTVCWFPLQERAQ